MLLRALSVILLLTATGLTLAAEPPSTALGTGEIKQLISDAQFTEAEAASRALLDELAAAPAEDPVAEAIALDLLAEALWRGGKSRDAETLEAAERALALKEAALGPDAPEVAESLKNVATILRLRAEPERIQALLERAIEIQENALGPEHPDLIKTLNSLGSHYNNQADYEHAEPIYLRSLELSEAAYGLESRQVAVVLNNLASMYQESGTFEQALPLHERAIAIMEVVHEGKDHPEVAAVMNSYANTLSYLGSFQESADILAEALAIREKTLGPEHRSVAASLNNLSLSYRNLGDLAAARPLQERAIAIWEKAAGPEHPLVAQGYNNLGTLVGRLGDFEAARQHLDKALAIREGQFGPDHPAVAQTLLNQGKVLVLTRDYAGALPLMERTIAIWVAALGDDNPFVAMARENMAQLLLKMGDIEGAREQFELALAVRQEHLGAEHPMVAVTMSALGELLRVAGEFDKAAEMQGRALAMRRATLGEDHPEVAISETLLAAAEFDRGQAAAARQAAVAGANIYQRSMRNTMGVLSEREALILLGESLRPEVTLFSGLLADQAGREAWLEACWGWTLEQRGLVIQELARRHRAAQLGESPEAQAAWEALIAARRLLAARWVQGPGEQPLEAFQEQLARVAKAREEAEIEMARVSAGFRHEQEAAGVSLADVRSVLPKTSALVEIVRVPIRKSGSMDESVHDIALVHRGDGTLAHADLGPAEATDNLISSWRRALDETSSLLPAAGDDESLAAVALMMQRGAEVRQAIWNPIEKQIREAETVFLIPDGSLHLINLAALPDQDGVFLLEDGPSIHLLSASRDLVRTLAVNKEAPVKAGQGVLVLGAPDFDASSVTRLAGLEPARTGVLYRGTRTFCTPVTQVKWPALPQSSREAARVESLFKESEPVTVLSGFQASEERLKMEAPGKRVLHLATHGYFLEEQCATVMRESPLLLSGLVLAGANQGSAAMADSITDDGVLTAEEVTSLDLRGVELAVLSACDTGRGAVHTGEGVFGLRQSLEMAGVRTVVMSVWPVPDGEARRWMTAFYQAILSGMSISEATRTASLSGLQRLRAEDRAIHPYLWGGFVVAGDWR